MKKIFCVILSLVTVLCLTFVSASASVKQTEHTATRNSSTGTWWIKSYAAFDRFATPQSNANKWNYKGTSTVYNPPVKGTNTLKITSTATVKTSASINLAGGASSAAASTSSTWQTITATWSRSKSIAKGDTSKAPNSEVNVLIIQPKKYYKANTAGIIVTAGFTRSDNGINYTISAAA